MDQQPEINMSADMSIDKNTPVEISQEDKERFLKSVISDSPYEEVLDLFDGKLKVKFRTMTVQENTDVANQVLADQKNGKASDTDAYFITIAAYRMGLSLMEINNNPYSNTTKDNFSPSYEKDTYILARAALILNWPTIKLSAFIDIFNQFEKKLIRLAAEVQNPNFWKASA